MSLADVRESLRDELPRLFADRGCTVVYATTEPTEALLLGGQVATLREGTGPNQINRRDLSREITAAAKESGLDTETVAGVVRALGTEQIAALGKTMLTGIDFCFEHAKEIGPALLLMHGTADKLTYPSGSADFDKLAGETNKDVTLKLWDGMYHEIHNEPEKAQVFKQVFQPQCPILVGKHSIGRRQPVRQGVQPF